MFLENLRKVFRETTMKKRAVLLASVILLSIVGLVQAQQDGLHGLIDVTYQSKYIWRGFDMYADKSAIQPAIDVDLFGTGFGVSVMGHRANSSGFEAFERWDYTAYYYNRLFHNRPYATAYRISWVYYNFPEWHHDQLGLQEINGIFSWPKVLSIKGLVPTYVIVKMWPSSSESLVSHRRDLTTGNASGGTASGWFHIFMLDYAVPVKGLVPEIPEHKLNLHAELVYNDGVGPLGQYVDHDWSHAVFGVSTDINLGKNYALTPALYHQVRMEETVNSDKDETWVSLSLKYKF
jgi:hypothetical protein